MAILSSNEITQKINQYIGYIENSEALYWNAGIVPTKENWGFTKVKCASNCTSNNFPEQGRGTQCYAFARFIAYLLTDTLLYGVDGMTNGSNVGGGWTKITDLSEYDFKPGDIVETNDPHTAIVLSSDGITVQFLELWSRVDYGCKIKYGYFYNGNTAHASVEYLRKTIAQGGKVKHVIKCPPIEVGTPAPIPGTTVTPPEPEEVKVQVSFQKNTQPDGGPLIETREYTVGQKYNWLPSDVTRTGFIFNGWWPDANTKSREYTVDTIVPDLYHSLYAHWKYKLFLHKNDGTDAVVESTNFAETGDTYGNILSGENMTRTDYTLTGWKFEDGSVCNMDSKVNNVTKDLYAQWKKVVYKVTLNYNDGTNTVKTITGTLGGKYTALANLSDRYGYKFMGWNTMNDGEGTYYDSNSNVEEQDLELYAIWEAKTMKVTYNFGLSGVSDVFFNDVKFNEKYGTNVPSGAIIEAVESSKGLNLSGWYHPEVTANSDVKMDTDHTVYAKWEPKEYVLSFKLYDCDYEDNCISDCNCEFEESIPSIKVKHGQKYGMLPIPHSKKLFKFSHWSYNENGENQECGPDSNIAVSDNHTLTANWITQTFVRFIYENENGNEITSSCSQLYGYEYRGVPSIIEKTGYTSKWVFSEEGSPYDGAQFFPGMIVSPDHPTTIRAIYTAKQICVTYDYCGGIDSFGMGGITACTSYNTTYDSYNIEKTGYTFNGWYYDEACTQPVGSTDVITNPEPHTIYAGWKKNIILSFDPGDSSFAEPVQPKTVYYGEPYGDLPVPKSTDNYLFYGWAETDELGETIESTKTVENEQDHTAVAIWSTFRFLILNPNGGTCNSNSRPVTFGNKYPILPSPTREGYNFEGWYFLDDEGHYATKCERRDDLIVLPEHPDTVYAKWTPKNITVTYNGMGGSPVFNNLTHAYGSNYALPYATRTGYTLTGWFFDEGCTERCTVDNIVSIAEDHTLYAGWASDE